MQQCFYRIWNCKKGSFSNTSVGKQLRVTRLLLSEYYFWLCDCNCGCEISSLAKRGYRKKYMSSFQLN